MEHDVIIISLIYIERLIDETGGSIRPNARNWRSILLSSMLLASKVWDDLSMWNVDFYHVCRTSSDPVVSCYNLERINQLERLILETLHFKVRITASMYAEYYFEIRSMLLQTGQLDEKVSIVDDINIIYDVVTMSGHDDETKEKTEPLTRRTKSLGKIDVHYA